MDNVSKTAKVPARPRQPSQGTKPREKNFQCHLCSRRCTRPCELEEHLNMHSGVKRHSCVCGYKTTYRSNLTRHRHTCRALPPSPTDEAFPVSAGSPVLGMPIEGNSVEANMTKHGSQHSIVQPNQGVHRSSMASYAESVTDSYRPPSSYPSPSSTQYEPVSPLEEHVHYPIHSQSSHPLFSGANHSNPADHNNTYGTMYAYEDRLELSETPPTHPNFVQSVQFPSSSVRSPGYRSEMQYGAPTEMLPNSSVAHPESQLRAIDDHLRPREPSTQNGPPPDGMMSRRFSVVGNNHYASPLKDSPHLPNSSYSYSVHVDPHQPGSLKQESPDADLAWFGHPPAK